MSYRATFAASLVGLLAATILSGPVLAQGTGGGQGKPPAQSGPKAAENVKDAELEKFVAAVMELQEIKQSYSQEMGQAGNKKKAQALQEDMRKDMRQAIKDEGLSVKRYSRIGQAVQQDPELKEKVNKRLQDQ